MGAGYFVASTEDEALAYSRNPLASYYASGSAVALVIVLLSTAGLFARQRWAAYTHVASTVVMIVLTYRIDAPAPMGAGALVSVAIYVLTGMIYGVAFFTGALVDSDRAGPEHQI